MPLRFPFRLAASVALAAFLSACASEQEKLAGHIEQGKAYVAEDKHAEALIEFRNALKLDPKSAETNHLIAQVLIQQGKYGDALFYLRETQRLDPTRSDAALDEAKLLMGSDIDRADALVAEVLEREPSNPMAHLRRMEVALHRADTGEALAAAMTARELAPDDPLYAMQVGIVRQAQIRELRAKGETPPDELFEQAVAAFRQSDEQYGGDVFVRINLGKTFLSWPGHEEEAEAAFRSVIEHARETGDPEQRRLAANAGLDYARIAGNDAFAEFALEELVAADSSDLEAWARLAALAERQGKSGEDVYRKLLEARPDDLDAHWRYGVWLFANGRGEEAVAHLSEVVGKAEDRPGALERLSAMQLQAQQAEAAKETIATLEKEFPNHPSTKLAQARKAVIEGRYADAAPLLRSLAGQQESSEGQRLLAVSEYHLGNHPAAVAAVDRSIALGSQQPLETLLLKARIHHAARDANLAIQTWSQVVQAGYQIPPFDQVLLASSLYAANRADAARDVLEKLLAQPEPPLVAVVEYANQETERSPEKVRRHLDAALARAPYNPALLVSSTRVDILAGREKEALERLDAVVEAGRAQPAVLLARARILAGNQRYEEAERDVNLVFEAAPNMPGALDLLVQIYAAQDKLDEAVQSFEEADQAGALGPGPRTLLGRLYLSRGERDKARQAFERALSERPDLAGAKNDLSFLLAERGMELDRALGLAQEAQQALPNDPNVADTLGYVYYRKGLLEPALQQHRYALQLAEESGQQNPMLHYHLGVVLKDMGRNEEAAEAFEQALAIDPEFSQAGEARKALEAARAGTQGAPSSSS